MYCLKDNCQEYLADPLMNESNSTTIQANVPIWVLSIRTVLKPGLSQVRALLPGPMADFDDTGILMILFFIAAIVVKLLSMFMADKKLQDMVDRRFLHDCVTRLKEQDILIAKLKSEALEPEEMERNKGLERELVASQQRYEVLSTEFENARFLLENCQHDVDRQNKEMTELQKDFEEKISELEAHIHRVEIENRDTATRIKDLEQLLKKAEDQNLKLENKLEHEERRTSQKILELEAQLAKANTTLSSSSVGEPLSLSGNSSDRKLIGAPLESTQTPSLWSDVEGPEMEYSPFTTHQFLFPPSTLAIAGRTVYPTTETTEPTTTNRIRRRTAGGAPTAVSDSMSSYQQPSSRNDYGYASHSGRSHNRFY